MALIVAWLLLFVPIPIEVVFAVAVVIIMVINIIIIFDNGDRKVKGIIPNESSSELIS